MRIFILAFFMISGVGLMAQDTLFFTRTGHIYFISHTDIIDIDAHHYQVGSFLNLSKGELAFTLLMKSFEFTLPLAEEHFNENYIESEKYPKASFKGKLLDYGKYNLTVPGSYHVEVEGDLEIHGVVKKMNAKGEMEVSENTIKATSSFNIELSDYRIKVPSIVADRVAQIIPIDVEMVYHPYPSKGK